MSASTAAPPRERRALITDAYDDQVYNDAADNYLELMKQEDKAGEKLRTARDLVADLFGSFHQRAPVLRDPTALAESHRINREIMGEITGTQEHKDLRMSGTVGNALASALATIGTVEDALAAIPDDDLAAVNALADAEKKLREHLTRADAHETMARADPHQASDFRQRAARNRREAAKLAERMAALGLQLADNAEDRQTAVRRAARGALVNAAHQVSGTLGGIGMLGGDAETMALDQQLAIADELSKNRKLFELAAICGRFERLAIHAQRSRVDYAPSEVASVHTGNDLARVLPGESVLLGDPALEDLWYLRYAESTLQQYELVANEPSGKGPIIVAGDESGSMASTLGRGEYSREMWMKAVTLALAGIARRQQRDFAYIGFASGDQCYVERIPAKSDEAPMAALLRVATHNYGGGTEYEPWMARAVELAASSAFNKADVIVLSDGEAAVSGATLDAWRAFRKERGTRCYGVMLTEAGEGDAGIGGSVLGALTDQTFYLHDFARDDQALRAVFAV